MLRLIALIAVCLLAMPIARSAAPPAAPTLSQAEQQQLVANAKAQLDAWPGKPDILHMACDDLSRVIKANPRNAAARVQMARCYMYSGYQVYGRYDQSALDRAGQELSVAYQLEPSSPTMLLAFAALCNLTRQPDQAQRFLDQAEAAHADPVATDVLRARAFILSNKWREAQESVAKAESNESKLAAAMPLQLVRLYELKGDVDLHFHRLDSAKQAYRRVTVVAPEYAWGHGNYAEFLLLWKADANAAIPEAKAALDLMNYSAARFTLGAAQYVMWANLAQQSSEEARAELRLAQTNAADVDAVMARIAGHVGAGPALAKLVQALLKKGVSIDARDPMNKGSTALTLAVDRIDMKSIDWLIAHKANVNAPGIYDRTPLFMAVERDDVALVNRFTRLKADVNIPGVGGETPLMAAAGDGNSRMVRMLLDAGADPTPKINGQDAADIATFNGHPEIAQLIRGYKPKHGR